MLECRVAIAGAIQSDCDGEMNKRNSEVRKKRSERVGDGGRDLCRAILRRDQGSQYAQKQA